MSSFIDKIIGEEGVKTDVQISIAPSTYVYLAAALFVGLVASRFVSTALFSK